MPKNSPNWFVSCLRAAHAASGVAARALVSGFLLAWVCLPAVGQVDRQRDLDQQPLAEAKVQSLTPPQSEGYSEQNVVMMFQPEQEDPLSFYARTQDGEWLIPAQVDRDDPWVRLLILGPIRPTLVDVAIEINGQPYRAARELWIDKLLAEAKEKLLARSGAASVEGAKTTEVEQEEPTEEPTGEAADEPAKDASADEAEEEKGEAAGKAENEVPMVAAQSRKTRSLFQRLINYLAADPSIAEHEASREELRWLLAEWTGGPALLNLNPAFAWRRADAAPLWHALDRDGDRILSRQEIEQASETFRLADINRDDNVDLRELERLGKDRKPSERIKSHPLVLVLDEETDWKALKKEIRSAYAKRSQSTSGIPLHTVDLANLLSLPADVVCRVSFASQEAKITLLAAGDSTDSSWQYASATEQVILVERQGTHLEFSAAQGEVDSENASGDMQQTQVAVGAVVDGFPLFRQLDRDNNRQLTLRERRSLAELLTTLDRNQDGQLEPSELPTAIRLAVTHGPQVHKHLAKAVSAQREHSNQNESEAPAWFVGMDRNHDGDLSQREFQGSPERFAKFDRDGDGLISLVEILETEAKK